jgi:hypothetical protein
MKKRLSVILRHLPRRWLITAAVLPLLVMAAAGVWIHLTWHERAQQAVTATLANGPYQATWTDAPRLVWGWRPQILLPVVTLQPRQPGRLPKARLTEAALTLGWRGDIHHFKAAQADIALATPLTLRKLVLSPLKTQTGLNLSARYGPPDREQTLLWQLGETIRGERAMLLSLGSLEAAGVWRTTPEGGELTLPRLRLDQASGSGRFVLRGGQIDGGLQFDRLRVASGSGLPLRALLAGAGKHLGQITLAAGQLEAGGLTLGAVQARLDQNIWSLTAGQGPRALSASGTWQADAGGWSLPTLSWQSRSMAATGSLSAPVAGPTRLGLTATRLDLTTPGGNIDIMRLLDWVRSRRSPIAVTLTAPEARLPLLPPGELGLEMQIADGTLSLTRGDWRSAAGDVVTLGGSIDLAALFPKLDLTLTGERAARPDRLTIHLGGPATHPELTMTTEAFGHQGRLAGAFNFLLSNSRFKGTLDMHGPRGQLATPLRIADGILRAEDLRGSWDGVPLSGTLALDPNGPLPRLSADLSAGQLTLEQLGRMAALGASGWGAAACPERLPLRLPPFASTLSLRVASIPTDLANIQAATLFVESQPGGMQGRLNSRQGQVDLNLRRRAGQPPEATLRLNLQALPLTPQGMFRQGVLDLSGVLSTSAPCAADWTTHLRGPLTYRLRQAQLMGIDLDRLSAVLANTGLAGLLRDEARAALGRESQTVLPVLSSQVILGGGILQQPPVMWESAHYSAEISGYINISDENIDLKTRIEQKIASGTVPLTLYLRGKLAAPDVQLLR